MSRATLAALGVVIAFLLFFAVFSPAKADTAFSEQMLAPSAQLNGNCSATLIWSDRDKKSGKVASYALTAKHCVEKSPAGTQLVDIPRYQKNRIVGYDRMAAKVKAQDYKSDLALLVLVDTDRLIENVATVAPSDIELNMGDPVWVVGYPRGMAKKVTAGIFGSIETINFPKPGTEYFTTSSDITGGNSGGGLFARSNDGRYVLIGVSQVVMDGIWFMSYFGTLEAVHDFLDRAAPEVTGTTQAKPATPSHL